MNFKIREAKDKDANRISDLLYTIAELHHRLRPDLFKSASSKYKPDDLYKKFAKDNEKIFVATDENDVVLGYIFCVIEKYENHNVFKDHKFLYIDDLCVDENARGCGIATALMDRAVIYAKEIGCHNITLNVWEGNTAAEHFYEKYGMKIQSRHMELILK